MRGKSGLSLFAADARIEQESNAVGFDVDAVAVASGLQGDDFHGGILLSTRVFCSDAGRAEPGKVVRTLLRIGNGDR